MHWRTLGTGLALFVMSLTGGLVGPSPIAAQEMEIDRERMTQFVRAHIAINDARDEFHGAVARVHDEEGRTRAREEVEATIEGILEAQEMTREEYDEMTLMISLDGDLRIMFDEILEELTGTGGA